MAHAHGHAHGANGDDAHAFGHHAPGKQTQAQLEPAGSAARGSSPSLFTGALPWESAQDEPAASVDADSEHQDERESDQDSEHDREQDGEGDDGGNQLDYAGIARAARANLEHDAGEHDHKDGLAHAARANSNPYKPGGNRPHVLLKRRVRGTDQDGQRITVAKGTKPAISSVAGNAVVMYLSGGKFVIVKASDLKRAVSSPSNLKRAIGIRRLKTRNKPPEGTERTVTLPPNRGEGWKPAHTGGESLTGRESGIIWGATNETGADGSGTGYVALPMRTGTKFRVTREHTNPTPWVRQADNATGKAVWAHGWAHVHGKWVKQVMVARIEPDDSSLQHVVFLP